MTDKQRLEQQLWNIADTLRGKMTVKIVPKEKVVLVNRMKRRLR